MRRFVVRAAPHSARTVVDLGETAPGQRVPDQDAAGRRNRAVVSAPRAGVRELLAGSGRRRRTRPTRSSRTTPTSRRSRNPGSPHAEKFCLDAVERFGLGPDSRVVEIASNDGYLLAVLRRGGSPRAGHRAGGERRRGRGGVGGADRRRFFGSAVAAEIASRGGQADLVVANNVLAHVPDLNDFVAGIGTLLAPDGYVSIEVPHLLRMLERAEFDTIYHEHFSYFSVDGGAGDGRASRPDGD